MDRRFSGGGDLKRFYFIKRLSLWISKGMALIFDTPNGPIVGCVMNISEGNRLEGFVYLFPQTFGIIEQTKECYQTDIKFDIHADQVVSHLKIVEGLELTDKDDHFFVSVLDVPSMTLTEVYPMTAERRLAELANLYRIERSQNFFFFQMSARDD